MKSHVVLCMWFLKPKIWLAQFKIKYLFSLLFQVVSRVQNIGVTYKSLKKKTQLYFLLSCFLRNQTELYFTGFKVWQNQTHSTSRGGRTKGGVDPTTVRSETNGIHSSLYLQNKPTLIKSTVRADHLNRKPTLVR